jgi:hypothetical protein
VRQPPSTETADLISILGVRWNHAGPQGADYPSESHSELDDDVAFVIPTTAETLSERPDLVAMEICRSLLFSVNLSDVVDRPEKLDSLIGMAYSFNSWNNPDGSRKLANEIVGG